MLILDSNLWIHALTVGNGYPDACIDRFLEHTEQSAVNAYICSEVITNIHSEHSIPHDVRDKTVQDFCLMLQECPMIEACDQSEFKELELEAERDASYNQLAGDLLEIQPKDVPILTLAYDHLEKQPTVCTDDESFAELTPAEYGLPEISIEHVKVDWERPEQPAE